MVFMNKHGFTFTEVLVASAIALLAVGGIMALWFMVQDAWLNERMKSSMLQEIHSSLERVKREMEMSDGNNIYFHVGTGGVYDAASIPLSLDDGRSDTGYSALLANDGFLETDSATRNPITGVERLYWDKSVIYHVYDTGDGHELRRTVFYPRDNSLTTAQLQAQLDQVVSLGTGDDASVPDRAHWESTRSIFKGDTISFMVAPRIRSFDGYNSTTAKTESPVDFGSTIIGPGYHTIKFIVTGKNPASSGYIFGIDGLTVTPAGHFREAEDYIDLVHPDGSPAITASSGDTLSKINMHESAYGLWSADYYLKYAANAINDYLTIKFYYDLWRETNFQDGVSDKMQLEFSNTDGAGGSFGDQEYLLRLKGNTTTWDVDTQTHTAGTGTGPMNIELGTGEGNTTYRNLLMGKYLQSDGMMLSVKFRAGDTYPLTIQSAYIIQRSESAGAAADDGSTDMPSIPITFNGCGADPRNGGQSGTPTTVTGNDVTIPAGCYAWSNWIQLVDNGGAAFNFDMTKDYFVSFYVAGLGAGENMSLTYWEDTDPAVDPSSYTRTGQTDSVAIWGGTGTAANRVYAVEEVYVTYVAAGSFISQIFDTAMDAPAYNNAIWTAVTHSPDATLQIRARSSGDKVALEGDGDWSVIPGIALASSPGDISSLAAGRYVQFRVNMAAMPGGTAGELTSAPYDMTTVLKSLTIDWPGSTTMVDVAGHFTKASDYGMFTVEVDGNKLIKGYGITLSVTETLSDGSDVTRTIGAEVEPRNTNK